MKKFIFLMMVAGLVQASANAGDPWAKWGAMPGTVQRLLNDVGGGKLKGSQCKANAAKLFTANTVIDNRGPAKNRGYFKKYRGLNGVCDLFGKAKGDLAS